MPTALTAEDNYGMMRKAATTRDDPKMVEWYRSVNAATTEQEKAATWKRLKAGED